MYTPETKLPDKLSDLIEVALNDLNKIERRKGYRINMHYWHRPNIVDEFAPDPVCSVCLAGCVIALELGIGSGIDVSPSDFDGDTMYKLRTLDRVREGSFISTMRDFYSQNWDTLFPGQAARFPLSELLLIRKKHTSYSENRRKFKLSLRRFIRFLRKYNL